LGEGVWGGITVMEKTHSLAVLKEEKDIREGEKIQEMSFGEGIWVKGKG